MKNLSDYTLEIIAVILLFLVWVGLANAQLGTTIITNPSDNTTTGGTISGGTFITPDPLAGSDGDKEYTYRVCGKSTINGKTTGYCGTGKSKTPHDDECSVNEDCPSGSGGDGGGIDGGGGGGQDYYCNICSSTSSSTDDDSTTYYCTRTKFSYDCGGDRCQSAQDCKSGNGGKNPPSDGGGGIVPPGEPAPDDPDDGNTKDCSYCKDGECYTYKGPSYCTDNCRNNPDICTPKEKTKTCSDCRNGSCYKYIGEEYCTDYCSSNPSICDSYDGWPGSSGRDDVLNPLQSWLNIITDPFTPPPPPNEQAPDPGNNDDSKHYGCSTNEFGNYCMLLPGEGPDSCSAGDLCTSPTDGWHTECLGDNIGTTAWCTFVAGEGTDQCDNESSCQTITNNRHTECINDVCQWVSGQGPNICSQTDGTQCVPGGPPHKMGNILDTIKDFFGGLWTGFLGVFSR